jgi:hypothetical protein
MKNQKITMYDSNTIPRMVFDEDNDAIRVSLIAGKIELPEVKVLDYTQFFNWIKVCLVAQTLISLATLLTIMIFKN